MRLVQYGRVEGRALKIGINLTKDMKDLTIRCKNYCKENKRSKEMERYPLSKSQKTQYC